MVTATKPITTAITAESDRLLVLYRREAEHWCAEEMLDGLIEVADSLKGRGRRVPKREQREMDVSCDPTDPAELIVRALVMRGHARDVESYIEQLTLDRFRSQYDWNVIGGPDHDDARDLFIARALDLKEADPEAFTSLVAFGESLVRLNERKPMKRKPARAAGSRARAFESRPEKGAA